MAVTDDATAPTLTRFVTAAIAAGSTVHTDGWGGYRPLSKLGYDHQPRPALAWMTDIRDEE